jgi:hypothetical protein
LWRGGFTVSRLCPGGVVLGGGGGAARPRVGLQRQQDPACLRLNGLPS